LIKFIHVYVAFLMIILRSHGVIVQFELCLMS